MKTIKELSDAIGISKVSLYKLLKRDDIKPHVFKRDNTSVVDETGEQLIRDYYNREQASTIDDIVNDAVNQPVNQLNADIISLLQEQLKEKDNQINALLNIVTNQQKLQATQYLVDNQHTETPDKPKKGFFDKLFRKQ